MVSPDRPSERLDRTEPISTDTRYAQNRVQPLAVVRRLAQS